MASEEMDYLTNMAKVQSQFFGQIQIELARLNAQLETVLYLEKERLVKSGMSEEEAETMIQEKCDDSYKNHVQRLQANS